MEQKKLKQPKVSLVAYNEEDEEWRVVEEFPWFEISSYGRLRSKKTNRILQGRLNKDGYLHYCLRANQKPNFRYAHRLVALAFLGKPEGDRNMIDHIDRNKLNNSYKNLRWATRGENRRNCDEHTNKQIKYASDPIILFGKDGQQLCEFKCINDAAKVVNRSPYAIAANIHKQRIPFSFGYFELKKIDLE